LRTANPSVVILQQPLTELWGCRSPIGGVGCPLGFAELVESFTTGRDGHW
jgi:hypothetical protein